MLIQRARFHPGNDLSNVGVGGGEASELSGQNARPRSGFVIHTPASRRPTGAPHTSHEIDSVERDVDRQIIDDRSQHLTHIQRQDGTLVSLDELARLLELGPQRAGLGLTGDHQRCPLLGLVKLLPGMAQTDPRVSGADCKQQHHRHDGADVPTGHDARLAPRANLIRQ